MHGTRRPWVLSEPVLAPPHLRVIFRVALLATTLLIVETTHAGAQAPARNFQELGLKAKVGDTIYITDNTGQAEEKAEILELTPSLLGVRIEGIRRDFAEGNVTRIRQRVPDSRKNGALVGFLLGAAGSTTGAVLTASPSGNCKGECIGISLLYGGGVGSLIGVGIDSLVKGLGDIYLGVSERQASRIQVRPFASSAERGVRVSYYF